jgi:glycerol uptake facilitator-like aquaporin
MLTPIAIEDDGFDDRVPLVDSNAVTRTASKKNSSLLRECSAEVLGTFVMMMIGIGVCAQKTFSTSQTGPRLRPSRAGLEHSPPVARAGESTAGSYLSINLAWGLGVYFGIAVAGLQANGCWEHTLAGCSFGTGGVSGAHLNPAVTLALVVHRCGILVGFT